VEICSWDLYSWSSCNDGNVSFQVQALKKVQELAPEAKGIHYAINRCALAGRTLPTPEKCWIP